MESVHVLQIDIPLIAKRNRGIMYNKSLGDFTFWISLLLRPSLSTKYRLKPKISEK